MQSKQYEYTEDVKYGDYQGHFICEGIDMNSLQNWESKIWKHNFSEKQ